MKIAYIAGAFTAPTDEGIERNILRAERVAGIAISLGLAPIIPHSIGRSFKQGPGDYEFWCAATLEMLQRSDVVFVVPGYEKSKGTLAEIAEAERLLIPILYAPEWENTPP